MFAYTVRRIITGVLMLVLMSFVTYVLFFASTPNPARYACGPHCTPQQEAVTAKAFGYDKPIYEQWGKFAEGIVKTRMYPDDPKLAAANPAVVSTCDAPCLGFSRVYEENVRELLFQKLPISVSLAVVAFVMWMVLAVIFGVISALTKGSLIDRGIVGVSLIAYAFPTFFIGLVFLDYLTIQTSVFKPPSYQPIADGFGGWLYNLILPSFTLALVYMAGYVRIIRAFVLETSSEDYIRTARAKGLSAWRVVFKHTLRAVLTPLVTLAGLDLAGLLGGAIITESVFNFNGLGRLSVVSIGKQDLPVVVGIVLLVATFVIVANIVVDLLYAVIDPRVRLG